MLGERTRIQGMALVILLLFNINSNDACWNHNISIKMNQLSSMTSSSMFAENPKSCFSVTLFLVTSSFLSAFSSMISSSSPSILGAYLPFLAITLLFYYLFSFSTLDSATELWLAAWLEDINLIIYLCFSWDSFKSFYFYSKINFFRSSSCFKSFFSLSKFLIF